VAFCRWWHHLPAVLEWGWRKKEREEKKSCKYAEYGSV